ncbi:hypothetical protein ACPCTO_03280 [Streptomyces olivoreticuli]
MNQRAYESGASLKGARGHEFTPEHPQEAEKRPEKYELYRAGKSGISGKYVNVVTPTGTQWLRLSKSDRGKVARHWNGIKWWMRTGEAQHLAPFEGATVKDLDTGELVELETNGQRIWLFTHSRQINIESLYTTLTQ